jgi:hypothetical protein
VVQGSVQKDHEHPQGPLPTRARTVTTITQVIRAGLDAYEWRIGSLTGVPTIFPVVGVVAEHVQADAEETAVDAWCPDRARCPYAASPLCEAERPAVGSGRRQVGCAVHEEEADAVRTRRPWEGCAPPVLVLLKADIYSATGRQRLVIKDGSNAVIGWTAR